MSDGIVLTNVATGYAGVAVARDLDLEVRPGEVVALLGPNGAGKTTTLLTISGLITALSGSITIDGEPVDTRAPHRNARRGVAHVTENRSLLYRLTVEENLRVGVRGSRSAQRTAIDEALDLLPALQPLLARRAGLLSGGEQQMLAMARALASKPRYLLVDEMSLGLAPVIVERLLPVVRDVATRTGVGVLLVEQHVHMALDVADRGYVMNRGRLVMQGSAADLARDGDRLRDRYMGDDVA